MFQIISFFLAVKRESADSLVSLIIWLYLKLNLICFLIPQDLFIFWMCQQLCRFVMQSRCHGNTTSRKEARCWLTRWYCFHSQHLYYGSLPRHFPQIRWCDARSEPIFPCHPSHSHTSFPALREDRDVTVHELHEINLPSDGKRVVLKVSQGRKI